MNGKKPPEPGPPAIDLFADDERTEVAPLGFGDDDEETATAPALDLALEEDSERTVVDKHPAQPSVRENK